MKKLSVILFFIFFSNLILAQEVEKSLIDSIKNNFVQQRNKYPQEKLYVQIDKPHYIIGEKIWFRAHLVDALTLTPDTTSRYVYAELINQLDSVQVRAKIRPKEGAYHGYISIEEDLPAGEYQLRFYTRFMEGRGDDFFFKRTVYIGDPLSGLYRTELNHRYSDNNKKIDLELSFVDIKKNIKILPDEVRIGESPESVQPVRYDEDGIVSFSIKKNRFKEVVYLEYDYQGKFHKEFLPIPNAEDYEVSFLPEGGNLVVGVNNKIAFKALNADGIGETVTGVIVNETGDTLKTFAAEHLGMGAFFHNQLSEQEKFYAICKNQSGIEKRYELPSASVQSVALSSAWQREKLLVEVRMNPSVSSISPYYLIIQSGGNVLSVSEWKKDEEFVSVSREFLPSGIIQLLLVDKNLTPISERLVFNINKSDIIADASFVTNKGNYGKREKVTASLSVLDSDSLPEFANVSVSITDNEDVKIDTCVNILSTMLITSELRGHVENPAYYFKDEQIKTLFNLDLLMMTQGWSKYNVANLLKGDFDSPKSFLELGPEILGKAESGILLNRKAKGVPVKLIALQQYEGIIKKGGEGNHSYSGYFDETITDEEGRFAFSGFEFPDSTQYVVMVNTKKGGNRIFLTLEEESYPSGKFSLPFNHTKINNNFFENYFAKADQKFVIENGMRMIYLKDIEITASRKNSLVGKSRFSSSFNNRVTSAEIVKNRDRSLLQLLSKIPGVTVMGNEVRIRGQASAPLLLIDDLDNDIFMLDMIPIEDVEEVEVVKDAGTVLFGSKGSAGAILITTKRGQINPPSDPFNVKSVSPLGYQVYKEFYSPQYNTKESQNNSIPDLRSTIYWSPSVQVADDGDTIIDFYTSDSSTTYSVVIEGVTSDGQLIFNVYKINRKD